MEPRRSTSGATVVQLGDYVVKLGDGEVGARVGEQGEWLVTYGGNGVVTATVLSDTAYVMPVLQEWPQPVDTRALWKGLTAVLEEWVWMHEPIHSGAPSHRPFHTKVEHVWRAHGGVIIPAEIGSLALRMEQRVRWDDVPRCLTHGDPTFANTMHSEDGLVLTDPLPSSDLVPDIRAKDLGKLLQSCVGYERDILGWEYLTAPDPLWVWGLCQDENEWQAAKYCGVMHIMRLMPYVARAGEAREWAIEAARAIADL